MSDYEMMYTELKEALVGDSPNWTHEELIERALEFIDGSNMSFQVDACSHTVAEVLLSCTCCMNPSPMVGKEGGCSCCPCDLHDGDE